MKRIQLSDHFTCGKILLFALPSIGMQIVDNTYQIADGYFISNYIGEAAFEAENLIFPPLLIIMYVGLMFGTGASALISRELGEGRKAEANRLLSLIAAVLAAVGVALSAGLYFLLPSIAGWVGASEALAPDCVTYGRVLAFFMPFQMLSMAFHPLLITAERPGLGLATTLANAAANILLDWAFVAGFGWGMRGAAIATGLAWLVSAVIPFVYFASPKHALHFARPRMDFGALGKTLYNGASEMVDAVAYALVALIFNLQMLRYLGEAGVGAYAVSEYVGGLFSAVFYGVSMSIVPVVGYHLGKKNLQELHSLRRNGFLLMGAFGLGMTGLCLALAGSISRIFVGYNEELTALAIRALRLVSFSFLLGGITTYASSYFTGLNQGSASLIIAVVKGFAGPLAAVWLLPRLLGADGLWLATPLAEVLALGAVGLCFLWWRKREDEKVREGIPAEGEGQ
ncbi:MAG: polysaccharide biosynthesis C-terminal domain-containing protein [Clostridia bacterium]|nr:polysaccharide biosynthesis C-terminal domain-containing protein [Clostridia bacterium]